jgi:hypothetical protein
LSTILYKDLWQRKRIDHPPAPEPGDYSGGVKRIPMISIARSFSQKGQLGPNKMKDNKDGSANTKPSGKWTKNGWG